MPTIDKTKLSKEVSDKYSFVSNAFRHTNIKNAELDLYKNEPKDEINVEIGDTKEADFLPQIKLMRWTNEVNFSVRLKDTEVGEEKIETLQDKIKYSKGNIDIEFYDYAEGEGGYKLIWFLKEKPLTNKVEFTIQSKGLDFFYQPELTQKEKDEGASCPENVVGSYAVYHSTKGGMNDINGKEYKTGKAFHIFRPHIIDAQGKETWGILHIENGIYSVEIPQEFLDTAVYPIKSNDTFGYTSVGASSNNAIANEYDGTSYTMTENGTLDSISFAASAVGTPPANGTYAVNTALYYNNAGTWTYISRDTEKTTVTTGAFNTFNFASESLSNGVQYYILVSGNAATMTDVANYRGIRFDAGGTGNLFNTSVTYGTWPATVSLSSSTQNRSIYATYTPSGGSAIKTINGLAKASVKTVNGLAIASVKTWNGLA